jgi:cytochrome P450
MDPENYNDPYKFDGFRFMDNVSGTCNIRDTITPTEKWLPFAIGSLTCPGRVIGLRVCQIMLSMMLMEFNMELIKEEWESLTIHSIGFANPNPEIKMRVKSRCKGVVKDGVNV